MRDIRDDLRGRLAAIQVEYNKAVEEHDLQSIAIQNGFREKTTALDRERVVVLELLKIEEGRPETVQDQRLVTAPRQLPLPMAEFIITKLHASGPMTKEELRAQVDLAGYLDGEATGRTFHLTLMNISTGGGRVSKLPDGRYAFRAKVSQTMLFDSNSKGAVSGTIM